MGRGGLFGGEAAPEALISSSNTFLFSYSSTHNTYCHGNDGDDDNN